MLLAGDELKTIAGQPGRSSVVLTAGTYLNSRRRARPEVRPPKPRASC
jgi:hypothetical protein